MYWLENNVKKSIYILSVEMRLKFLFFPPIYLSGEHMFRSENEELGLSFHYVGSVDQTQVLRLGGKCLYPRSIFSQVNVWLIEPSMEDFIWHQLRGRVSGFGKAGISYPVFIDLSQRPLPEFPVSPQPRYKQLHRNVLDMWIICGVGSVRATPSTDHKGLGAPEN